MRYILFFSLLLIQFSSVGQDDATVEKSTGIQVGFLGAWVHQELPLAKTIVLRAEVGMDAAIWGGMFWPQTGYIFTPVLTAEPRFYYNLRDRGARSKKTIGNSADFFSIKTSFHPNAFVISNYSNIEVIPDLTIVPTFGMRRHIGSHISFETGLGIGYRYTLMKSAGYAENYGELAANVHVRMGYTF